MSLVHSVNTSPFIFFLLILLDNKTWDKGGGEKFDHGFPPFFSFSALFVRLCDHSHTFIFLMKWAF